MQARVCCGAIFSLFWAACGSIDSGQEPASPDQRPFFEVPPGPLGTAPGAAPGGWTTPVANGSLFLEGHLEGRLHDVALSADTTSNSGSFELWENGGGFVQLNIAANGVGGAGMLIVYFTSNDLAAALSSGQWTGVNGGAIDSAGASSVNSCAGPVMGDWPYELPAVGYDMSASEDPEDPGTVVVQIKSQFPRDYGGAAVSELIGTIAFARFVE
jgi:hypothetical protein